MNAKLFASKNMDMSIIHREYCVDGKVHFTRVSGGWSKDQCIDFRPCKGECIQHEFVLPDNVAAVVFMAERDNFVHRYRKQLSAMRDGRVAYNGPNPEYKFSAKREGWPVSEYWEKI